jgi:hypothetical protein
MKDFLMFFMLIASPFICGIIGGLLDLEWYVAVLLNFITILVIVLIKEFSTSKD